MTSLRNCIVEVALVFLCAGCATSVRTATIPAPAAAVTISITNNLGTAVNAYVLRGATQLLLGEVGPNTTRRFPARGIHLGEIIVLRATRVDGSTSYTRENVRAESNALWSIP